MSRDPQNGQSADFPHDPVLVRIWRGDRIESHHRGAWVVCDSSGAVVDGAGGYDDSFFARSSVKSLQALPLIETGAADRFGFDDADIALALASHNAEDVHTERVEAALERLGLSPEDLRCGPQPPGDPDARYLLRQRSEAPGRVHNNCSGKHAGFLALARHLGVDPEHYLDPESESQALVRRAVVEMTDADPDRLFTAIDGCSAPTFRFPLRGLATAFARMANPDGLPTQRRAACERMLRAVARHPVLIAGSHRRMCTDIARVSGGRLFPKLGGEAVYAVGVRGSDRGIAVKIADGGLRGLHALVVELLERFEFVTPDELAGLDPWRQRTLLNWDGVEIGRTEVLP